MLKPHVTARAVDMLPVAMIHQTVNYYIITKENEWVEVRKIRCRKSKLFAPKYITCFAVQIH